MLQYWEIYRLNGLDGLILHLKYRNKQTWDGGCAAARMQLFRILTNRGFLREVDISHPASFHQHPSILPSSWIHGYIQRPLCMNLTSLQSPFDDTQPTSLKIFLHDFPTTTCASSTWEKVAWATFVPQVNVDVETSPGPSCGLR